MVPTHILQRGNCSQLCQEAENQFVKATAVINGQGFALAPSELEYVSGQMDCMATGALGLVQSVQILWRQMDSSNFHHAVLLTRLKLKPCLLAN